MSMDLMQTAKGRLALFAGVWIAIGSKLVWVATDKLPDGSHLDVAATDARKVYYNPDNINKRTVGQAIFIALHEIGHNMLCHLVRMNPNYDRHIMGLAMDYSLDELLIQVAQECPQLKMEVPPDAHIDPDPTNKGAIWEVRYAKMMKQSKGGKPGQPQPGEGKGFDVHLDPTNEDGTPMDDVQKEGLRKEWQATVAAAAEQAKRLGKLPGFMEQFINDLIKPKVSWEDELWHLAKRITHDESSYRRFNRRFLHSGQYLPGTFSEQIGALAYFCDTSGSITSNEFAAGKGAMTDILENMKPSIIHFGQCDTRLHSVQELTTDDLPLPALKIYGRGGTDMAPAFQWACEHEEEIDAFILQSDMFVPALDPKLIPNVPVIVIATTDAAVPSGYESFSIVRVKL